jgi:hypothetical protein
MRSYDHRAKQVEQGSVNERDAGPGSKLEMRSCN